MSNDVIEMCLCETEYLYLKPDQLYLFVVMPGCQRGAEMARLAQGELGDAEGLKCDG